MNQTRSAWLVGGLTALAFALILGVPFTLRPEKARLAGTDTLVIVSPHDEGVKAEFERAFNTYRLENGKKPVKIEWRSLGGAGDIRRYVETQFATEFRRAWGGKPPEGIDWLAVDRGGPATGPKYELTTQVRNKLANVGIDIDILFGAGDYEHTRYKRNGWTVPIKLPDDCDYLSAVPADLNGVPLRDADGYWFGAVLTRVGILTNLVVCDRLKLPLPRTWSDLADPRFRTQLALADANMSGSAKLCYEMVLQSHGWEDGWRLLTRIAANARYFGASSTRVAVDVSRCEATAGMIIDYYGRTQVEYVGADPATGRPRLRYTSPEGRTATTPDPISVFRGTRKMDLAREFVGFVLSEKGQKLWMGKVGSPDGPQRFGLYRPPIRPDIYRNFAADMISAENPFDEPSFLDGVANSACSRAATLAETVPRLPSCEAACELAARAASVSLRACVRAPFNIDPKKSGARFDLLGAMMRAAFIDNSELLVRAADHARDAEPGSAAQIEFDAPPFSEQAMWYWAERYRTAGELDQVELEDSLTRLFRDKYRRVLAAPKR